MKYVVFISFSFAMLISKGQADEKSVDKKPGGAAFRAGFVNPYGSWPQLGRTFSRFTQDVWWPGKAPGETGKIGEEKILPDNPGQKRVKRITNVTKPILAVFRPYSKKDTGTTVLIAPGGSYSILAWDLEGEEVAAWLNSIGVTGIVLKYRVPRRPDQAPHVLPLQDAQRAMSLIRSKAEEWGIDAERIGMLGFSAGAHLTAATATNFDKPAYQARDDVDKISSRPDFIIMIYPGGLIRKDKSELSPEIRVSAQTPPAFVAHAGDDPVPVENSVLMYLALKHAKVSADLHIYATGGHGFGLRQGEQPCLAWPQRCEEWMRSQGFLKVKKLQYRAH